MSPFQAHMAHYRNEHRSIGCRITHMIGVPMILSSIPILGLDWRLAIALFAVGWTLQLVGHRYFECNKPVLAADPKNPMTYLAALVFVGQEWVELFTGRLRATPVIHANSNDRRGGGADEPKREVVPAESLQPPAVE